MILKEIDHMSSIIEGYTYDIFISYRQKDNKGDMWVSEFVESLKTELESTFKEEISVYFDINPHDGLLETYDVDASLKDKLKCVIFIPVISRTYCDPKSFAWEHEFKAFVEQASKDQFGLKVKLPNGNVAGRVLPVQIHDLDKEDIAMCESVTGSVLRGIEFIYKSAGVNRPLLPKEENPQENLNHTNYRDQINKAANAIKDIITAIQYFSPQKEETPQEVAKPASVPQKSNKAPIIAGSVIASALIILGILFIPRLFKPAEELEKSIAVLPFFNDSSDPENAYFINGAMDEILNNLQKIKELRVLSRTSVEQYRGSDRPPIPRIARELDVNYIIEGSGQKYGNQYILRVQLIFGKNERHLWADSYEKEILGPKEIYAIHSEIAQSIASELKVILTPEEKQLIEKTSTENLDAYYTYMRGNEEYSNYLLDNKNFDALTRAEDFYSRALEYDPSYAQAYTGLAQIYWEKHYDEEYFSKNFMDSVLMLAETALSYDKNLAEAYSLRGDYYRENTDYNKALKEYQKALKLNPNYWQAYYGIGVLYSNHLRDAINGLENYKIALKLNHNPKERPDLLHVMAFGISSGLGFYDKAIEYEKEALELNNDSLQYYTKLIWYAIYNEKYSDAIRFAERSIALDPGNNVYYGALGQIYYTLGDRQQAVECFKKYIAGLGDIEITGLQNRHRVGFCYLLAGNKAKAEEYFELQKKYCEESIELDRRYYARAAYAYYDLACIYAINGDKENAYKNLHIYNNRIGETEMKGMVWYLKTDPFLDSIRNEPEFQAIYHEIEAKYNNTHEKVRQWLEEHGEL